DLVSARICLFIILSLFSVLYWSLIFSGVTGLGIQTFSTVFFLTYAVCVIGIFLLRSRKVSPRLERRYMKFLLRRSSSREDEAQIPDIFVHPCGQRWDAHPRLRRATVITNPPERIGHDVGDPPTTPPVE